MRRSHEVWFHFTKEPRYFSAVDEIREPHIYAKPQRRNGPGGRPNDEAGRPAGDGSQHLDGNPLGKLPGSVWSIPTQPLQVPPELGVDHFAAFPMEWPRRIIQGWSPAGVCVACGEPRAAVWRDDGLSMYAQLKAAGKMRLGRDVGAISEPGNSGQAKDENGKAVTYAAKARSIVGYSCGCVEPTAPTVPAVILDPFGGTGTTALVAKALGRHGISNDMSADYCRLATWRTNDPGQLAAALQVEKPKKPDPEQDDLLAMLGDDQ